MFKKFSSFFVKNKGDDREPKKLSALEKLIVLVIAGVVIILAASVLARPDDSAQTSNNNSSSITSSVQNPGLEETMNGEEMVASIERRLAELLSKVEGAGQVSVMIYADSSSEHIPAYNNEQETRNDESESGKSSAISETRTLALMGDNTPVILKTLVPQIRGVVVVAEGADDMLIKEQLNRAVCTLLGIPEHRVQILKHK
jgi:stage III sporulation protein AG